MVAGNRALNMGAGEYQGFSVYLLGQSLGSFLPLPISVFLSSSLFLLPFSDSSFSGDIMKWNCISKLDQLMALKKSVYLEVISNLQLCKVVHNYNPNIQEAGARRLQDGSYSGLYSKTLFRLGMSLSCRVLA